MSNFDYSIHYKKFHNETEEHADGMANLLLSTIKPHLDLQFNASILDIGCGFGFTLRALKKLGYTNVKGLEISKEQGEIAKKSGFDVIVTKNSVNWMLNNPDCFDFVILFDVLEHLPIAEQIDFLRAIYTVLKPKGKLLLTVPNANSILSSRWRFIDFTHYSSFTEYSLDFVLKNAQFDSIWIDSNKGIGKFPKQFWKKKNWVKTRRWIIRWSWLQVYKAEIPWENIDNISFELNLTATALKL